MMMPMTDSIGPFGADGWVPEIWIPQAPLIVASVQPRFFFGFAFCCAPTPTVPTSATKSATPTTRVPRLIFRILFLLLYVLNICYPPDSVLTGLFMLLTCATQNH